MMNDNIHRVWDEEEESDFNGLKTTLCLAIAVLILYGIAATLCFF